MVHSDERAASSVIGVVILVAVTVILAGTASVYVLGIANSVQEPPPSSSFEFDYSQEGDTASYLPGDPDRGSDNLSVSFVGGETIRADRINVTVTGAKEIDQNGNVIGTDLTFEPNYAGGGNLFGNTGEVSAGDSYTISDLDFVSNDGSGNLGSLRKLDLSDATVRVYWLSENGETGSVIAEWTYAGG
ncbi:type IV pilin N-terminal domain-containing protein [Halobaculum sp. CBA1158]|uniref:type IV pilin n=1 Tax=Halobaculum sp. CBA1158 TaxID=2904243 RepID=UPI001F369F38|nr:type IV pilin N-terminal domain-containing protein [Halobaculum sp. CBA1158]UIO99417.1 type IV pilin N-terminal domain-containing protein [Halobaculum sp. CBA1158]